MSKARLVITAVTVEHRPVAEVAVSYTVSRSWIYELLARYREEGEAAFEPRSRRPRNNPNKTPAQTVELILQLRQELTDAGHDAGADTIAWHLQHHHGIVTSRATVHRTLTRAGKVTPEPKKRPKSSYTRFEAEQPNQTWQSDFTHYRLSTHDGRPGPDTEIITWLDDHSRYALHLSAHPRITARIVLDTFRATADQHGHPASTLTDNGMVYTVRGSSHKYRGGRTALEKELRERNIEQKNGRPSKPTTQGKVERFQQTMKKWLRAQPDQPTTISQLQALLDQFATEYNTTRPHRSLPHRAPPATAYQARPKATPHTDRTHDTHDRVHTNGVVTLRHRGKLHKIGIGRTHAGTHIKMLVQDLHVRVIHATTGELLRDLTIDPTRTYHGTGRPPGPPENKQRTHKIVGPLSGMSCDITW